MVSLIMCLNWRDNSLNAFTLFECSDKISSDCFVADLDVVSSSPTKNEMS